MLLATITQSNKSDGDDERRSTGVMAHVQDTGSRKSRWDDHFDTVLQCLSLVNSFTGVCMIQYNTGNTLWLSIVYNTESL